MNRDMDLVRKILLAVEKEDGFDNDWRPEIDVYSVEEIAYHLEIMKDAGLLVVDVHRFMGGDLPLIHLKRMTWEGHEFLDAARNEPLWNQATEEVLKPTGGLVFEILKAYLLKLVEQALE